MGITFQGIQVVALWNEGPNCARQLRRQPFVMTSLHYSYYALYGTTGVLRPGLPFRAAVGSQAEGRGATRAAYERHGATCAAAGVQPPGADGQASGGHHHSGARLVAECAVEGER
jgi:hypothetical protein